MSLVQFGSMSVNASHLAESDGAISGQLTQERSLRQVILRSSVWLFGILIWLIGMLDRAYFVIFEGVVTVSYVAQFLTMTLMFAGWLYLKPQGSKHRRGKLELHHTFTDHLDYLGTARARMTQLQKHHLVSQEYVLPFPYNCQIYHLLNLKHLETVHSFSLNNLKVEAVSEFQPTAVGGKLRFQTKLNSPINVLRLWRQRAVDVELTLHTPFTVELQIPVHNDKVINLMFNALPLNQGEHRFHIDIYSNLPWPKVLLRFVLEFAASLTLLEDLPYLHKLTTCRQREFIGSEENLESEKEHTDMMQLYHRYVSLYCPPPHQKKCLWAECH